MVDPRPSEPYLIFVCFAKSSAFSMGDTMRCTVRNAAKLAVYELMRISVNSHQKMATNLVLPAFGVMSDPCCMRLPTVNQKLFSSENWFSTSSASLLHGWALYLQRVSHFSPRNPTTHTA